MSGRGFFAIGIEHGKTPQNLGTLWRTANLYDAAFVFTIGKRYAKKQSSDTMHTRLHTPMFHFGDVDDLVEHLPWSTPLVGVELDDTAIPLASYGHPVRACYLLGAEDHGLSRAALDRCHDLVVIESALPFSMNVAVAGSIICRDRHVRGTVSRRAVAS